MGLRDRALIGVMAYTFFRFSAVVNVCSIPLISLAHP
jgi:hypothetical protein